MMKNDTSIIYVLELEDGYFYVGKTKNLERRIQEHKSGEGSSWTKLHPFVCLLETIKGDALVEDMMVKKYMLTEGIEKVRGGSYSTTRLTQTQTETLSRELRGATDVCFRCGRSGHFVNKCYAKTHINGTAIEEAKCLRCGRNNHTASKCFAKIHADGSHIK